MSNEIENLKPGLAALRTELENLAEKIRLQTSEIEQLGKAAVEARARYDSCLDAGDTEGMAAALATIAESRKKADKLRTGHHKPSFLNRLTEIEGEQERLNQLAAQEQSAAAEVIRMAIARKDDAERFGRSVKCLLMSIAAVRDLVGESSGDGQ